MAKKEEGISEKAVHTKGPWKFEFDADGDHAIFAGTKLIAVTVGLDHFSREEDEANAAVLAAAPELLTELEHICAEAESWHSMHHAQNLIQCDSICKAIPAMKSAILKARGEQL